MDRGRRPILTAAGWCFGHWLGQNAPRTVALMLRSIAARASTDASTDSGRCDASRSMRAPTWPVLILRDARTPIRLCRAVGARALLRMRTGERVANCGSSLNRSPSFYLTMSNSPSRSRGAFSAPGVLHRCFAHPNRGVGGAPRDVRVLGGTPVRPAHDAAGQALARRLASHDAGRSPLGAPPWRFWAPGAALPSPSAPAVLQRRAVAFRIRAASSSHPGRSAWRAGSRASRGERLRAAAAGRHASLRIQDRL